MRTTDKRGLDDLLRRAGLRGITRRQGVALGLVALVIVGLVIWRWWPSASHTADTLSLEQANVSAVYTSDADTGVDDPVYLLVHVSGAVANPGVYRLQEGLRVNDALIQAGGFAEGASTESVNLARVLVDGEQVYFPTIEEAAGQSTSAGANTNASSPAAGNGLVNINTADAAALDTLPGIGPSTAAKIIADREAKGAFGSTEEIKRVSGIGDAKYEQLAAYICV